MKLLPKLCRFSRKSGTPLGRRPPPADLTSGSLAAHLALVVSLLLLLSPRVAAADESAPPPPAQVPSPPLSPAPVGTAPATAAASAIVQLDADDGRATIERRVGTASPSGLPLLETGVFSIGQWEHACISPCTLKLDTRYAYRVAGDGLVPTDSFALPHGAEHIRVDAKMGSSTGRLVGGLSVGGGLTAIALGGIALIATPILKSEDVGSEGFRTGVLVGGLAAVSVGVIAVAVGGLLWASNGSTARTQVATR